MEHLLGMVARLEAEGAELKEKIAGLEAEGSESKEKIARFEAESCNNKELNQFIRPVESSPPPLPSTALRHAHALRASRTASPPDPSPHGGTLPSSFPPTSASSATCTSTPQHRSHSPPAHDPRTRTIQRNRAPRLSSRLSHYGPISPDQLLFSLPFSSPRSASPGQRSFVSLRASRTPRSPASSRPLPALILVQRRLLERQRSRSSRRC